MFYGLLYCCSIENVWKIWLIKVGFVDQMLKLVGKWPAIIFNIAYVCTLWYEKHKLRESESMPPEDFLLLRCNLVQILVSFLKAMI